MKGVGCLGLCAQAPLVSVESEGILYHNITPQDVPEIVEGLGKEPVKELQVSENVPFFNRQRRVVLDNCGKIDPERIEDYISLGGYSALLKALMKCVPQK